MRHGELVLEGLQHFLAAVRRYGFGSGPQMTDDKGE